MSPIALVVLAPIAASVLILALRRYAGAWALAGVGVALVAALDLLAGAVAGNPLALTLPGLPGMPLRLIGSPLTALLSVLVAVISGLVAVYAVGYMAKDAEKNRFFATILFFISAMQVLVLAGDWISLLAAWELIGFSSYLLIGFWHARVGVASAATRAFIYTRSADLGLYIGAFVLIGAAGTSEIAVTLGTRGPGAMIAGLLLLVAAIGKSAQAPLHDWLQRAMVGPTPVSALLHSATLVAAGAILLIRTAPMLPPETLLAVGLVGGITTVLTGLIALSEGDLKRLLAASTSSQYGLMLLAVGAGAPIAALLHLIAHAAIKSSLFTAAGVFQRSRGSTEMDALRGAGRDRPRVFAGFVLAALALAGIPPLSGFFSKDTIIAAAFEAPGAAWLAPLALVGTLLTGAYMARALHVLWRGTARRRALTGLGWMGTGLAGLVVLAVTLGAAFPFAETMTGMKLPESALAVILGLGAALSGLALGWFVPAPRLLGPILPWAQTGFAVAGGFDGLMLRPALAVARGCERVERGLYDAALAAGRLNLAIARGCERVERELYGATLAVGRLNLAIGQGARRSDEDGIDRLIFRLVRGTLALGARARRVQSGLVHRELALSLIGAAVLTAAAFSVFILF